MMKLILAILLMLSSAAWADMYPDASNANLPAARVNLGLGNTSPVTFGSVSTSATPTGSLGGNCFVAPLGCIPNGSYAINLTQVGPVAPWEHAALADATNAFVLAQAITHNYGGPTVNGGRESFGVFASLTAPTSPTNQNRNYVAAIFQQNAVTGDGGTALTVAGAKGGIFAINPIAVAFNGATNLLTLTTGEVNIQAMTGSSALYKSILSLVPTGLDTVHGTSVDAMLLLSAQAAIGSDPIAQYQHGIVITNANGVNPITPTGVLFGGQIVGGGPAMQAGVGIDLSAFTFATAAYTSTGFAVDPTGSIEGRNLYIGSVLFGDSGGAAGYNYIHDPAGNAAIAIGSAGNSDPSNRYRNTNHYFEPIGGGSPFVVINATGTYTQKLAIQAIPTSAGAAGLYICIDNAGNTYKKASCP